MQTMKQLLAGKTYCGRAAEWAAFGVFLSWNGVLLAVLPGWASRLSWLLLSHAGFMVLHLQVMPAIGTCLETWLSMSTSSVANAVSAWQIIAVSDLKWQDTVERVYACS